MTAMQSRRLRCRPGAGPPLSPSEVACPVDALGHERGGRPRGTAPGRSHFSCFVAGGGPCSAATTAPGLHCQQRCPGGYGAAPVLGPPPAAAACPVDVLGHERGGRPRGFASPGVIRTITTVDPLPRYRRSLKGVDTVPPYIRNAATRAQSTGPSLAAPRHHAASDHSTLLGRDSRRCYHGSPAGVAATTHHRTLGPEHLSPTAPMRASGYAWIRSLITCIGSR